MSSVPNKQCVAWLSAAKVRLILEHLYITPFLKKYPPLCENIEKCKLPLKYSSLIHHGLIEVFNLKNLLRFW